MAERAELSKPTARSLDVHAETEAAPPTVREGDARAPAPPAPEEKTLAERPTQLDTGNVSGGHRPSTPRLTPRLKEVPLAQSDGTVVSGDAPPASTYVGYVIDERYRIEGVLGRGGMGVVYRARHDVIDKVVAIKILLPTEDAEVVDRFVTEARAATAIGNAHIVDTVDFGRLPDGSTYFVMEYLEGQTLAKRIKAAGFIPEAVAVSIVKQIAEGMDAAHRAGIVHRDLKPENIFLVDRDGQADFVKLLDFGIAKVERSQNRITRAGTIFGTPHYMSPEQAAGREVDARTDVYAVGVILYEMLSGKTPFDAENPMGLITQHLYSEPTPLARLSSPPQPIPHGLDAIVLKCLCKDPDERYPSMADFILDLERVERQEPPEALQDLLARAERADDSVMVAAAKAGLRASPPGKSSRGGVVAVVSLVLVGAATAFALRPGATPDPGPVEAVVAPSASVVPPLGRSVALVFSPIDGEVFRDGRSLGGMPVTVQLSPNEVATVEVRREGFYPETVRLDGSRSVVVVRLSPIPGVEPRIPVPTGEPLDAIRRALDGGAKALSGALVVTARHHDAGAPSPAPVHVRAPAPDAGNPHLEAPPLPKAEPSSEPALLPSVAPPPAAPPPLIEDLKPMPPAPPPPAPPTPPPTAQ
ncbi:MAG TPA: serine/threonine-protein kinase [Polyangiaceae bacterium]|nr:serine/threonine-protein kinase [Polyangiaceae bacterium]